MSSFTHHNSQCTTTSEQPLAVHKYVQQEDSKPVFHTPFVFKLLFFLAWVYFFQTSKIQTSWACMYDRLMKIAKTMTFVFRLLYCNFGETAKLYFLESETLSVSCKQMSTHTHTHSRTHTCALISKTVVSPTQYNAVINNKNCYTLTSYMCVWTIKSTYKTETIGTIQLKVHNEAERIKQLDN